LTCRATAARRQRITRRSSKSVYEQAWTPPDDTSSDDADIKVRVTIGQRRQRDFRERSFRRPVTPKVDRSVRSTLERVQFIAPFPSGTSDKERTYIIKLQPQI